MNLRSHQKYIHFCCIVYKLKLKIQRVVDMSVIHVMCWPINLSDTEPGRVL